MSVGSTSAIHHTPNNSVTLSFVKPVNHQLNIVPLSRVGVSRAYSLASSSSSSLARRSKVVLQNKFYGTRLQTSGSERLNVRQSNPRVVVRSALSQVPEKPLGLYDPSFDKDSCGVGFVAELSGESSRKTVTDAVEMLVRTSHRGARGRVEMCGTCFSLPNVRK